MYTRDRSVWIQGTKITEENTWAPSYVGTEARTLLLSRTRTGISNPHWRDQVLSGQNATTPMTGVWVSVEGSDSFKAEVEMRNRSDNSLWWRVKWKGHTAPLYNSPLAFTFDASQANARASNKFLNRVREVQTKMQGMVFLGEVRETLRMIRKPAEGLQNLIQKYLRDVRRAKNRARGTKNWTKELGNLWLEQAFGWTPLLNDIADARSAYNSLIDKDRIVHISAGAKDGKRMLSDQTGYTHTASPAYCAEIHTRTKDDVEIVRYRGAVIARAATTAQDRAARFGFKPSEFIPTAWELLPWSFLIDYFASIGDVLEGVVTDTSNVSWVNKSVVRKADLRIMVDEGPGSPFPPTLYYAKRYVSPANFVFTHKTVERSASGVPTPQLVFSLPTSPGRLLNIIALLAQTNRTVHPQSPSKRTYRI